MLEARVNVGRHGLQVKFNVTVEKKRNPELLSQAKQSAKYSFASARPPRGFYHFTPYPGDPPVRVDPTASPIPIPLSGWPEKHDNKKSVSPFLLFSVFPLLYSPQFSPILHNVLRFPDFPGSRGPGYLITASHNCVGFKTRSSDLLK